jgi:hypothetical protein
MRVCLSLSLCLALTLGACGGDQATTDDGPPLLGSGASGGKGDEFLGDTLVWEDDDAEDTEWGDVSDIAGPEGDVAVGPEETEEEVDPFAMAWDVTAHRVTFPEGFVVDHYEYAHAAIGYSLGGTEFWQKWMGGKNPTYIFGEGTMLGKRCMAASAKRFEAIMADPPEGMVTLRAESNWNGSFFNWNDDYSQSDWGDGTSARLWAWKTHLIKWISQTSKDGSCFLPTLEMVETAAANCMSKAESSNGEIVGCKAP